MRYSDRPITRPGDDALGRSGFALEVARSIDNLTIANEGFVMALVGEWGSGKTSVIELIVRYLRHIEMEYQPAFPRSPTPAAGDTKASQVPMRLKGAEIFGHGPQRKCKSR